MTEHIKFNLSILIFFVFLIGFASGQDQELKIQFQKAMEAHSEKRDLSWITSEQRKILIQQARNDLNSPIESVKTSAKDQLTTLDDEAMLQQLANESKAGNGLSEYILLNYGNEIALKYLTDAIYNGSSKASGEGDVMGISEMDAAVLGAFRIIIRSKSFPEETRKWAKKIEYRARTTMIGLGSDGSAVKSIRLWWEHNKEAVLSRQYAKATWLPSASEQVSDNPIVIKANSSHRSDPLNPASASVLPPRPSTNPSLPSWIYAVAICGLGLIGGLWYRFRK